MKKIKILLFIFPILCQADSWLPQEDHGKSGDGSFKVMRTEKKCQQHNPGKTCIRSVGRYDHRDGVLADEMTPDFDNASHSKSEAETCSGTPVSVTNASGTVITESTCETAHKAKDCADPLEHSIIRLDTDPQEVYCTKIVSVPDKPTGKKISVIDQSKRSARLASQATKKAARDTRRSQVRGPIMTKLKAGTALSNAELTKVLRHLLRE